MKNLLSSGALALVVVFAVLGLMPAYAADAASVTVPWGDWLNSALAASAGLLATAAISAKALLPAIVRPFVSDTLITNAVHSALARASGAVAGQKLDLPVANAVIASAVRYVVESEPKAAKALGDKLGPLVAAKLSQIGSAPAEAVTIPRVFGTPVK